MSPHVCFIFLISMFLRQCTYELGIFHANQTTKCLRNQSRTKGELWSTANKLKPRVMSLLAVRRRPFCFVSSWLFFFNFVYWLVLLLLCLFVFYVILALWPPALQYQLPALLAIRLCLIRFLFVFVVVLSGEPTAN